MYCKAPKDHVNDNRIQQRILRNEPAVIVIVMIMHGSGFDAINL